jgi:tetratricopeptide (TPR) repeat protein
MSEYPTALDFYHKTLEIEENSLPSNHSSLATTYINIGRMHDHMGEYSTALSFYQKAAEMQNSFPPNYPDLAVTYNCIGFIYDKTGEYSTALEFYQKTLHIQQKCLPLNHVGLAETYYNMARVFECLERHEKAEEHAERAMEIVRQSSLPSNHADIVMFRQTLDRLDEKK